MYQCISVYHTNIKNSCETVPPSESGALDGRSVNNSRGTVDMPKKTKGSKSATAGGSVPGEAQLLQRALLLNLKLAEI